MRTESSRRGIAVIGTLLVVAGQLLSVCAPARPTETPQDLLLLQFEIDDPDYLQHFEYYGKRLEAMSQVIAQAEARGRNLYCTQQMYLEAKWLYNYTAHWDRLEDKLKRIEQSLDDHDQNFAAEQSP